MPRCYLAILPLVGAALCAQPTHGETLSDLRGIQIGMSVKELPSSGYRDFACSGTSDKKLKDWNDWKDCTPGADGLRSLKASYDQPRTEGTYIAGHPVDLALSFSPQAQLVRIDIETDPKARLYLRKKAYLLGQQARYRYGENRWDCTNAKPAADEEPLGPTFIKEHCSKKLGDREVTIDRSLFRKPGSDPKNFISDTRISITWLGKPT